MSGLLLSEDQIIDYDLLTDRSVKDHFYSDIFIYYILEGEIQIDIGKKTYLLERGDFMVVNAFQRHSYKMTEHTLALGFLLSIAEIAKYYDLDNVEFQCNTTVGEPKQYEAMRTLLKSCINEYYAKRSGVGRTLVYLNSIYYRMIELLISEFAVYIVDNAFAGEDQVRVYEILNYIQRNYRNPLSLNDLANRFYMSTSYLSRYIKKKLGKNFGEYLAELRLEFAVKELENGGKSITKIAMDSGFSNIASFNKIFKEHFHMTPKDYQVLQSNNKKKLRENMVNEMEYRLLDFVEQESSQRETGKNAEDVVYTHLEVDTKNYQYIPKSWNKMINIGRAVSLLRGDVQEHLIFLHERLNFEYVRMWDLYDEEMKLNIGNTEEHYNFSKLDKIVDFLVNHQMRPYFELGFKPNVLMLTEDRFLYNEPREILFQTKESLQRFLREMMVHFVNRFGVREVSQWYFEQWCDPRLFNKDEEAERYFQVFEDICISIKEVVSDAKVGGAFDREYDCIDFEKLIEKWSTRSIQPDFMGIYCFQTRYREEHFSGDHVTPEGEAAFIYRYLLEKKQIMERYGMYMPVVVSEWSMTVVNRNVMNDGCCKGAYVMDVLMQIYGLAEMVGYWFGTDLFVETEESPNILDGCCGLISYHGICKPAFYAVDFMNRLGDYLLGQDADVMVTMDGYDNYMISCCNRQALGIQFYMQEERIMEVDRIPALFRECVQKRVYVKINHVRNGFYYVKVRRVSSKYGSAQDEWGRMGLVENLNAQDIDYLRRISTPRISIYEYSVNNNVLEINVSLEPHEIQHIHIFRQIKEDGGYL